MRAVNAIGLPADPVSATPLCWLSQAMVAGPPNRRGDAVALLAIFAFSFTHMALSAATFFWKDDWNWLYKAQQIEVRPWAAFVTGFGDVGWAIYRPLSLLCWVLTYRWWGLDPSAYAFMMLLPYFALASIVFLFGRRLGGALGGFWAAAIYLGSHLTLVKVLWRANFSAVLMAALAAGALYCLWLYLELGNRVRHPVLGLVLGCLGFLASEEGAFVCPMAVVFALCHATAKGWGRGQWRVLAAGACLAAAWWFIFLCSRVALSIPPVDAHFSRSWVVVADNAGSYLWYYLKYYNPLLLAAALLFASVGRTRDLKTVLLAWAVLALVPVLFLDFHTEAYLAQAMPGLCAVSGGAIGEWLKDGAGRGERRVRRLTKAAALLLAALALTETVANTFRVWAGDLPALVSRTRKREEELLRIVASAPAGATLKLPSATDLEAYFYGVSLRVLGRDDLRIETGGEMGRRPAGSP